jgi:hypothetical protein
LCLISDRLNAESLVRHPPPLRIVTFRFACLIAAFIAFSRAISCMAPTHIFTRKSFKIVYNNYIRLEMSEFSVYSIDAEEPRVRGTKYLFVFTDRRLIAAFESGGLTRLATAGVGRMAYDSAKIEYLKGKTFDELLSDNRSFFIPYNEISSLEFEAVTKKVLFSKINYLLMKINRAAGLQQEFMVPRTKPDKLDEVERYLQPIFREKLILRKQ